MKERIWHDEEKGEIYFNDVSMHQWRRESPHKIQTEFESIIGPAARAIISEAFKAVMEEVFANLAVKYASLEKGNSSEFAIKLLEELPKYGYGVPEAMLIDEKHGYAKIKVTNCFNKEGYSKTDKPVCYMMEGILASLFERAFKKKTVCRETRCSASGNPHCEFTVTSFNITAKHHNRRMQKPKGKLAPVMIDFDHEKGELKYNKTKCILVPRGTHCLLQQESQKIIGKGTKRIFYLIGRAAGAQFGRNFLTIRILSLIARMNRKKIMSKMAKVGSTAGTGRFEFEQNGWLTVRLYNSFNAHGAKKSKEPVCHVAAGLISGVCDIIFGKRVHTEEVKCIAKGDPYCEFHIKPEKE